MSAKQVVLYSMLFIFCVAIVLLLEVLLGFYLFKVFKQNLKGEFSKEIQKPNDCKEQFRQLFQDDEQMNKYFSKVTELEKRVKLSENLLQSLEIDTSYRKRIRRTIGDFGHHHHGGHGPHFPHQHPHEHPRFHPYPQPHTQPHPQPCGPCPPGPPGSPGLMGPPGVTGPPGLPGAAGLKGATGSTGTTGPKGGKGDFNMGSPGLPGITGAKGDKGDFIVGLPGLPGVPGREGAPGTNGPSGLPGQKGDPGSNGAPGMDGFPGSIGDNGWPGEKGEPGNTGIPGSKGENGDNGPPGLIGPKGEEGSQGPTGQPGFSGLPGISGPKGEKGSQGLTGLPGIPGPPGMPCPQSIPGVCEVSGSSDDDDVISVKKYGNQIYPNFNTTNTECTLLSIGGKDNYGFVTESYSCWMVDSKPPNTDEANKYWATTNDNFQLFEYDNVASFTTNKPTKIYDLGMGFDGNAHVIYNGHFFYKMTSNKPKIVKYDFKTEKIQILSLNEIFKYNMKHLYTENYNSFDFSVDENGLWVIFSIPESENTAVIKIDDENMVVQNIWEVNLKNKAFIDMFISSGILYTLEYTSKNEIRISLAINLISHHVSEINILVGIQNSQKITMATFDHKNQQLLIIDNGMRYAYEVYCNEGGLLPIYIRTE